MKVVEQGSPLSVNTSKK